MNEETDADVLDSLRGRCIQNWRVGEGGMHFEFDDGRVLVFAVLGGTLVIGVYKGEDHAVH